METLEQFTSCIDDRYREGLEMVHKGKDIDQAIKEAFVYLMADEIRMKATDQGDFKRLVNTWLSKQQPPKAVKNWKL